MRVLQLCCDPGIAFGGTKGASVHLAELARAFAAEGAEVLVVAARAEPGASPPSRQVAVEVMPGPPRGAPTAARLAAEPMRAAWLTRVLRDFRADLLYERVALHTTAGVDAAAAAGVPHLAELNAPLPEEAARYRTLDQPATAMRLEGRVLTFSDTVLAVSRPLADYATARGAGRVEVLPNAVDPDRFQPAAAAAQPPTAVFTGRLRPWHGAVTLAEAWELLGQAAPPLTVVGDGDGRDRLAAVGAHVTGTVQPHQVPGLLATAQIGLAPYPADAPTYFSPLKVFEYLAAGLAVVASDLPGVADIAGDAAVLVPPGDAEALAGAVRDLAADPARRSRMGAAGRAAVLAQHTWRHRAQHVLALAGQLRTLR